MMWIGPRPSKALITGACTEWSPPSTTGTVPESSSLRTAYSMLSLLLAVQHGVERSQLGLATSLNQFVRSVGAAVGAAAIGAILARGLVGVHIPTGMQAALQLDAAARAQFAHARTRVFAAGGVMSAIGLVASFTLPAVDFERHVDAGVPAPADNI